MIDGINNIGILEEMKSPIYFCEIATEMQNKKIMSE